jgi:hypothetical protein
VRKKSLPSTFLPASLLYCFFHFTNVSSSAPGATFLLFDCKAFDTFDIDNSSTIDGDELKDLLLSQLCVSKLLKEAAMDSSGMCFGNLNFIYPCQVPLTPGEIADVLADMDRCHYFNCFIVLLHVGCPSASISSLFESLFVVIKVGRFHLLNSRTGTSAKQSKNS